MTDEELNTEVDKLRNHPLANARGSFADTNRLIVALFDRQERQDEEIDRLRELVIPSVT